MGLLNISDNKGEKEKAKKLAANQKLILGLSKEASNSTCADCLTAKSTHACCTYGVFLCENCASSHAHGGAVVKEIQISGLNEMFYDHANGIFSDENVNYFLQMGNKKGNARYSIEPPPSTDPSIMVEYIFEKYGMTRRASRTSRSSKTRRNSASKRPRSNSAAKGDNTPKAYTPEGLGAITDETEFDSQLQTLESMGFNNRSRNMSALKNSGGIVGKAVELLCCDAQLAPEPKQPPPYKYALQLSQLREIGFTDDTASKKALAETSGNVERAIDLIVEQSKAQMSAQVPVTQNVYPQLSSQGIPNSDQHYSNQQRPHLPLHQQPSFQPQAALLSLQQNPLPLQSQAPFHPQTAQFLIQRAFMQQSQYPQNGIYANQPSDPSQQQQFLMDQQRIEAQRQAFHILELQQQEQMRVVQEQQKLQLELRQQEQHRLEMQRQEQQVQEQQMEQQRIEQQRLEMLRAEQQRQIQAENQRMQDQFGSSNPNDLNLIFNEQLIFTNKNTASPALGRTNTTGNKKEEIMQLFQAPAGHQPVYQPNYQPAIDYNQPIIGASNIQRSTGISASSSMNGFSTPPFITPQKTPLVSANNTGNAAGITFSTSAKAPTAGMTRSNSSNNPFGGGKNNNPFQN